MECLRVPAASDGFERAFAALESILRKDADTIAAVVLEPMVQGAAGMRIYDAEFLRRARALTREHDVFLVLDEVFAGYGRTGPMWASRTRGHCARFDVHGQRLHWRHDADGGHARDAAYLRGVLRRQ